MYLVSFFLTIIAYGIVGFFIGYKTHGTKRWRYNQTRFLFTTTTAGFIGGLLAELCNGSPDFGFSIINLLIAGFASVLSIYLAFPSYAKIITEKREMTEEAIITYCKLHIHLPQGK